MTVRVYLPMFTNVNKCLPISIIASMSADALRDVSADKYLEKVPFYGV